MQLNSSISAIITGGASGLGQATCLMLRAHGVNVALFDRDPRGAEIATRLGASFFETDVTSESAIAASLAQARAVQGVERILVNCAGIVIGKRTISKKRDSETFTPHDQAAFATVIGVNLIGSFLMGAQCAAAMAQLEPVTKDGGRGVIINTASIAAEDGQMGQAAYSASKGGVVGMTLPMARDLALYGIRVVSIMPGLFETPMLASLPDDIRASLEAQIPFPARLGLPEEYAKLVHSIIDNDMLNGTSIRLDGALRMQPK